MRTREEIDESWCYKEKFNVRSEGLQCLILEVLLDIRDLLTKPNSNEINK